MEKYGKEQSRLECRQRSRQKAGPPRKQPLALTVTMAEPLQFFTTPRRILPARALIPNSRSLQIMEGEWGWAGSSNLTIHIPWQQGVRPTLSLKRKKKKQKTKPKWEAGTGRILHGKSRQGIDSRSAISLYLSHSRFTSQESTAGIPLLSPSLTVTQEKNIGKQWKWSEAKRDHAETKVVKSL